MSYHIINNKKITIITTPSFFANDIAMIDLLRENKDSKYSEKQFKTEIKNENVLVALLEDDPIAYAIKKDNQIVEYYIEYEFENTNLKNLLFQS